MFRDPRTRVLLLLLLGMGAFFVVASILLASIRLLSGDWQPSVWEFALLALPIAVLAGALIWKRMSRS